MKFDCKKRTYHKTKDIVVETTGHDYDFAAYVQNLNDRPITIHFLGDEFDDSDNICLEEKDGEYSWAGFFLSQSDIFKAFRNHKYEIIYE